MKNLVLAIFATLSLLFGMTAIPAQAAPATSQQVRIVPQKNFQESSRAWDTLDYVFNKSPQTLRSLTKVSTRVTYVGTSKKPVSVLPLVSFRGRDAHGKLTHYVFAFTVANRANTIPAYQFKRLAKVLPKCKSEDSSNVCYWDAKTRGNKKGTSFVSLTDFLAVKSGK